MLTITKHAIAFQNSISQCFESQGSRCDLNAWRGAGADTAPLVFDVMNCELVLQTAAVVCPMGGSGMAAGGSFIFTIDPNPGSCGDSTAEPSG
ncbi:hypothetical protein NM688_g990 [Phlebia brevispora]|uniref:Uncharacterized protein n=1 Tax=Phlebia brevispora TaxID=194682 RepID=A0ACC1TD31_9APHY|nr:hypothetical protein NM688_g990 [Phlebia brevispora]